MSAALDAETITKFVAEWYRALDEHVPLAATLEYLVEDGLSMTFPEGVLEGVEAYSEWYHTVTHRFFDEIHEVTEVTPDIAPDGLSAAVHVVVNWQARIWDAPAPTSQWLGFDADQSWQVELGADGRPRIRTYVVNGLAPMPGSAAL